jgi:hypothetical protein
VTDLHPTTEELPGTWQGELLPQERPGGSVIYARRRFDFTATRWAVRFEAFVGQVDRRPIFVAQAAGVYALGPAWTPVAGARQLDLIFDGRYLTMYAPDLLAQLRSAGYPEARLGRAQDVTDDGALFVPPLAQAPIEYDVVLLREGRLHFGTRSPEMTTPAGRPTSVQPDGLSRVPV